MDEAGNGSAKRAVHAELNLASKVKASSVLRELPRKLELPWTAYLSTVQAA